MIFVMFFKIISCRTTVFAIKKPNQINDPASLLSFIYLSFEAILKLYFV